MFTRPANSASAELHDWLLTPESSHVAALSWEKEGEIDCSGEVPARYEYGTLYVAFQNGSVYEYVGVSESDWAAMQVAKSKGRALHRLGVTHNLGRRRRLVGRYNPETGVAEPSR